MRVTVRQDVATLRRGGYPDAGEQLGALAKAVAVIVAALPPAERARIPADALAVLAEIEAVKVKFPKGGRR